MSYFYSNIGNGCDIAVTPLFSRVSKWEAKEYSFQNLNEFSNQPDDDGGHGEEAPANILILFFHLVISCPDFNSWVVTVALVVQLVSDLRMMGFAQVQFSFLFAIRIFSTFIP